MGLVYFQIRLSLDPHSPTRQEFLGSAHVFPSWSAITLNKRAITSCQGVLLKVVMNNLAQYYFSTHFNGYALEEVKAIPICYGMALEVA